MGLFYNKRPRRFNHRFIYVDERKERLRAMERKYKSDIKSSDERTEPENLYSGIEKYSIVFGRKQRKSGVRCSTIHIIIVFAVMILFLLLIL